METVLISGGTGLIGTALSAMLTNRGYQVIVLTRSPRPPEPNKIYAQWDVIKRTIDERALARADHIVHLAGEGVADKRWTEKRKKAIVASRVDSATLLIESMRQCANHVQTFISASAIGWYGADPAIPNPKPFDENDPAAGNFLGDTCRRWEESVEPVAGLGIRLVKIRTGIVLSGDGGAFPEFKKPVRFGIAAIIGNGKQRISWIHIDDLCRLYIAAIENKTLQGTYNAVTNDPVSNKDLVLQIARKMRGKSFLPVHVPEVALKIALGELSVEILKSTTVSPDKIRKTGFNFLYPTIDSALNELIRRG